MADPMLPRRLWSRALEDWERTVAIAVGVVTLAAALLTYLAVLQDDASAEARGQSTLQTLQLQRQRLVAAIRVDTESGAVDRYRKALAEAEALEAQAALERTAGHAQRAAQLRSQALDDRYLADAYRETSFDVTRMTGTTSTSTYDVQRRLETIKGYEAFENLQPEQPAETARVADARHAQSVRTLLSVVLLLALVVLLTVGRILKPRWRPIVLVAAGAGLVVAAASAALNAAVGS